MYVIFQVHKGPFFIMEVMDMKKGISIRERKDGKYEARTTIAGQRYSRYGATKNEALRKMKELLSEYRRGEMIVRTAKLSDAMQVYLEDVKRSRVKATTFDRAESTFRNHIKTSMIGGMQIGTISVLDIQKLLTTKCEEGLGVSSVKKIYILLGEFFRYASATGIITLNPMKLVQMPHPSNFQVEEKEIETLSVDDMKKIIAVAESKDDDGTPLYRYGEAIIFLLLTGLRAGELRALKLSDFDLEKKVVYVHNNETYSKDRVNGGIKRNVGSVKTKKSKRHVPLNERAVLCVQRMKKTTYNPKTGYLICTSAGEIVTHSNLQRCYNVILKNAKLEHKGLHSTRHTFATVVLKDAEEKGQIKEVSELLGHSRVSTTYQYYIKTSVEDKKKLVDQLACLVS